MTVSIPNSVRLVSKLGPVCLFLSSSREEASLVTTLDTEDAVHSGIKTEMNHFFICAKNSADRFLALHNNRSASCLKHCYPLYYMWET